MHDPVQLNSPPARRAAGRPPPPQLASPAQPRDPPLTAHVTTQQPHTTHAPQQPHTPLHSHSGGLTPPPPGSPPSPAASLPPPTDTPPPPTHTPRAPPHLPDLHDRADITILTTARPLHIDVAVTLATSSTALAGTVSSSIIPGHAALEAERHKKNRYRNYSITPFAMETHGRFGLDALSLLLTITQHNTTLDPQAAYHLALQRLSTTLQLQNANTILQHYASMDADDLDI